MITKATLATERPPPSPVAPSARDAVEGSTLLRLSFVTSAYATAQQMIRFSDEKASFVFLFFGIILSVFGIRGDRVLMILGGQATGGWLRTAFVALFLAFLGTMIASMSHGLQTIKPRLRARPAGPTHRRLYWCHDVLRLSVSEYRAQLGALTDEALLDEMVHELYAAVAIERAKFDRIRRCLRWAVASLVLWAALIVMTLTG